MNRDATQTNRWLLPLILALYLGLGFGYSVTNPILESPDELISYENIRFMIEERRLPVLQPGEFSKAHHPPLYFLLGAVATSWVPNEQLAALADNGNPFWGFRQFEFGVDNKTQYLRDPALAGWPYRDAALGIHLLRWLSLLFGVGAITAVFATTRELFPQQPTLAPVAAALVAFNPMFLYIQSSVHNDSLTNCLAALTVWGVVVYWRRGPTVPRAVFVGTVAALGILTKITFLFLGPMVLVALVARSWQKWRQLGQMLLISGGIVLLLAGWWFVRNQLLYGEPTSMRLQASIWQPRPNAPDWTAAFGELPYLRDSFWGAFGWGQIVLPSGLYQLIWLLELVAVAGIVVGLYRRRLENGLLVAILLLAPLAAFGATFSRMSISATANFGRYLFTTYAVVAPLLVWGLCQWLPKRWKLAGMGLLSLAMLGLAVYGLLGVLRPAYAPLLVLDAPPPIPYPAHVDYLGRATLIGYGLQPKSAVPGQDLTVTLFWQVDDGFAQHHPLFVQLVDANGERVAGRDTHAGLGRFPTGLWPRGKVVVDTIPLPIPTTADGGPTGLLLTLGLKDEAGVELPNGAGSTTNILGQVRLAPLLGGEKTAVLPRYRLGEVVELVAVAGEEKTAVLPGELLDFSLTWHAIAPPVADYVVFMHLLDRDGQLVQPYDRPPQNGAYPTMLWEAGDLVPDAWQIQLPDTLEAGTYQLMAGWYRRDDLTRLPVVDADGQLIADGAIPLFSLAVGEPE